MQIQNYVAAIIGGALMLLSTASAAWVIDENFDGQTVGGACSPFWGGDGTVKEISADVTPGNTTQTCKMSISIGETAFGGGFVFKDNAILSRYNQAWIRFRLYLPPGFDFFVPDLSGAKLKFIRIAERVGVAGTVNYQNWYWLREGSNPAHGGLVSGITTCGSECWQYFGNNAGPVKGTWETYEMHTIFDTVAFDDGGQGRVRMWKNGVLIGDLTRLPTMWPDATQMVSYKIFSFWNGGSPATQFLYFDDLIATDTAPGTTDADGNPYIGVGSFVFVAPPVSPSTVTGTAP